LELKSKEVSTIDLEARIRIDFLKGYTIDRQECWSTGAQSMNKRWLPMTHGGLPKAAATHKSRMEEPEGPESSRA
jgi:hypothetical protein